MTLYETLKTFFSNNPDKAFSRKEIYKKHKNLNPDSIHATLTTLAREKVIIPEYPKKWRLA